jgi:hypothetical protein
MTFAVEILLALVPALLLLAALFMGRYPGERAIARLAARGRTARPRRAPRAIGAARRAPGVRLRPGELLARSLATRPPPHLLTV